MSKYFLGMFLLALMASTLAGCAASIPPVVFEPTTTDSVYSFYQNGYALWTVGNDSCRVVAEVELSEVAGDDYMRLWLLYYNSSGSPFLLDPLKAARLTVIHNDSEATVFQNDAGTSEHYVVEPSGTIHQGSVVSHLDLDTIELETTPPYKILASIDNRKTVAMIIQAIGGTAEALQEKPTTITNTHTGEQWQLNDTKEKRDKDINETNASIENTSKIYNLYKQSVVAGILYRNTVFPKQSVTGYIYFRLPSRYPSISVLHLEIFTQNGNANFDFKPVAGE
ncbi:MAG: hypothetical protein WAO19_10400 [Candidatus Kryptoniota bacterium]